jgi:hypothetical protein
VLVRLPLLSLRGVSREVVRTIKGFAPHHFKDDWPSLLMLISIAFFELRNSDRETKRNGNI